ncbi:hypothetical protein HMPREF1313_2467 [Bifidobacterium longum subsp. longum 1-6B]|uniref:Uncharacterized protein n=1 Tax=Bifidobacterium longum subsp. longum 1-6B TaxID=1161744 RepID=A0AA87LRQ3_BIFLL|nr:hypothetical protein [Bifidobacterium longum]EIJ24314.1 hypothetical protein HMPREF1313_2467 [Bifidobacterium longum subsp. longum 1-6B]
MSAFTQDFIIQPAGRKKHKTGAMDVPARLWNPDGTPFAGCSSTPADGSVTNAMLAGGITADKLAAGVIPYRPEGRVCGRPGRRYADEGRIRGLARRSRHGGSHAPKSVTTVDGDITPVLTRIG